MSELVSACRGKRSGRKTTRSKKKAELERRLELKRKKYKLALIVLIGATMFFSGSSYLFYQEKVLSFNVNAYEGLISDGQTTQPSGSELPQFSLPTKIEIPRVKISLPVTPSSISETGIWEISETGASFLNSSAPPGAGSNTVIYGHNKTHLFGPIINLRQDDEINIHTEDGATKHYKVAEIKTVTPDEISLVLPTENEVLTIYTCTGWIDSKRFVVRALPQF